MAARIPQLLVPATISAVTTFINRVTFGSGCVFVSADNVRDVKDAPVIQNLSVMIEADT
jgi:hypothetical protein